MFQFLKRKREYQAIEPDEILIDAANLPAYDTTRLEGKIERPIAPSTFSIFSVLILLLLIIFSGQLVYLQVVEHDSFIARAEENRLSHSSVIAERGLILDRNGEVFAENIPGETPTSTPKRAYPLGESASVIVGYVSYPKQDHNGYWYQDQTVGVSGIELLLNENLQGKNGIRIAETDAKGNTVSGSIVRNPQAGDDVILTLDAGIQEAFYNAIKTRAQNAGWQGGTGTILDIETGEILAVVSYPSYDPEVMSYGEPKEEVERLLSDSRSPFLDRAVAGLYTPGSVVKPFVAIAALEEAVISPQKSILSTGSISIPNPYDPEKPSVFKDWKAHGWVDMRHALAVSSDVYFYAIGGGYKDQQGLGIAAIEKYMRLFGFATPTGFSIPGEEVGVIPNPEWKAETFDGERWFLGNTYHTAIGQYGFQLTLMQLVRATAALANGGTLVAPVITQAEAEEKKKEKISLPLDQSALEIVREGMRLAVTEGTATALAVPGVRVAGKTGTAEVGVRKEFINSLVIGFFPADAPKYAFAVAMERAKAGTGVGAPAVMGDVLRYLVEHRKEMVDAGQ
ncbi:hypothetical protein K2P56_00820 [Patescibacteria group bacterium]|nr:hypothetical protein [Patescibacteria group bacterium]